MIKIEEGPVPIHYQISTQIKQKIKDGQYQTGDRLPSENELAGMLGVNRLTVRHALNSLVNEKVLYRIRGKGTFVGQTIIERPSHKLTGLFYEIAKQGLSPASRVLERAALPADPHVAGLLKIKEGELVTKIFRVNLADQKPLALSYHYTPYSLCPDLLKEDLENQAFHQIFEKKYALRLGWAEDEVRAGRAGKSQSQYLECSPGAAVLLIERVLHLEDGRPLLLTNTVILGEKYVYRARFFRGDD